MGRRLCTGVHLQLVQQGRHAQGPRLPACLLPMPAARLAHNSHSLPSPPRFACSLPCLPLQLPYSSVLVVAQAHSLQTQVLRGAPGAPSSPWVSLGALA